MLSATARRRRYRDDPEYRLQCINRTRKGRGAPTVASLAEADASQRCAAARRVRDKAGRFV